MARWRSPLAFGPLSTGATRVTGSPRAARYGRQPARRLWTALVAAQVVFAVIFGAFTAADVLPSAAGQETTAYAYDVAAYTYDAPALLSSQSATTTDVRGSPSGPAVVSWGRSASTRCCCSAANSGTARFVASSDGVVTDLVGSKNAISIGHYPEYVANAQATGARTFSMADDAWNAMSPTEQWVRNQRFLDDATSRGSEIQLATPLSQVKAALRRCGGDYVISAPAARSMRRR